MKAKRCVLGVADGMYVKSLKRLEESIQSVGFDGDVIFWYDSLPPGSPSHNESPCAFKIFAFLEAKRRGYESALWIDATGIVVRKLDSYFEQIEKEGYLLLGLYLSPVGEWSSDATLKEFGISREEAMKIPELLTFAIGLDFKSSVALEFLELYRQKSLDGISFRGAPPEVPLASTLNNKDNAISSDPRVKGHRWEQTVASLISFKLGLTSTIYGTYDLIGHAKKGRPYARCIPSDILIVQNRDIRTERFLPSLDKWSGKKGFAERAPYFVISLGLAIGRRIKSIIRVKSDARFDTSKAKLWSAY